MATRPDYYRILQVHPAAEPEVIQAAYRRLARKYHPDAGEPDVRAMQLLNEAYAVLSDPRQRAEYDRTYQRLHRDPTTAPTPAFSWWRALMPVILTLIMLVVFILDVFRLGVRGFPEITMVLVTVGWLVYHFSGLRSR